MSLYANIKVSKAHETAHTPRETPKKSSKSAALYADVQAAPPPQKPAAAVAPTSKLVDLVEDTTDKNTESLALQFKPTIRRIQKQVKAKGVAGPTTSKTVIPAAPVHSSSKSFLQDVSKLQQDIANDDVNGFYRTAEGQKIARKNARKNKKRKNNDGGGTYIWSWDDEYDPSHPNDYETYIDSDEQLREQIEWQRKLEGKSESDGEEEEEDRAVGFKGFAPPKDYNEDEEEEEEEEEEEWVPPEDDSEFVPPQAVDIAMDESADEVYMRRMRMAQEAGLKIRPPTPPSQEQQAGKVATATIEDTPDEEEEEVPVQRAQQSPIPSFEPPPPPQEISHPPSQPPQSFNFYDEPSSISYNAPGVQPIPHHPNPTISSEPVYYPSSSTTTSISSQPIHYSSSATIASDPVFYDTPTQPPANEPRSSHPGQKDFASRLMSKYGWQKGQSLGSSTQGLVTPLLAKHDKDRKGTGTIINRNKVKEDYGPFGKMTRCIVLANVVGLGEVDEDLADEIGLECREKYGEVERIRVIEDPRARNEEAVRVFVLFTSELSALRGVNALDGRLFGGRKVKARYYSVEKFEDGDFDR